MFSFHFIIIFSKGHNISSASNNCNQSTLKLKNSSVLSAVRKTAKTYLCALETIRGMAMLQKLYQKVWPLSHGHGTANFE